MATKKKATKADEKKEKDSVAKKAEPTFEIAELILQEAESDIGKKETKGNSGWEDESFEAEMKLTGWATGQAWCSYWAEKVWTAAYAKQNSLMINVIRKLFSANAVQTWENFETSNFETSSEPKPGALAVWMLMKGGQPSKVKGTKWIKGHIGIVKSFDKTNMVTIEGNTNDVGGREGVMVAEKKRKIAFNNNTGLKLLGFVHPVS